MAVAEHSQKLVVRARMASREWRRMWRRGSDGVESPSGCPNARWSTSTCAAMVGARSPHGGHVQPPGHALLFDAFRRARGG